MKKIARSGKRVDVQKAVWKCFKEMNTPRGPVKLTKEEATVKKLCEEKQSLRARVARRKQYRYDRIEGKIWDNLSFIVNVRINEGWTLVGGPVTDRDGWWFQAIMREVK